MTHRADQIIDAVTDAINSFTPSTVKGYAHRRLSLSEDQDELPAITVDFGEDTPTGDDGSAGLEGMIESLLTVNVTGLAVAPDEPTLRRTLLELRAQAHVAIKKTADQGMDFGIDTH